MNKDSFKFFIRRFIQMKINGGMILLVVALLAMIIANSPLQHYYHALLSQPVSLNLGDFSLFQRHDGSPMTVLDFISDALMTIFFFSTGLEIKREILVGELSSLRKALLPVLAACGGMICPVAIFWLIGPEGAAAQGAAIPMATDIAFSLGVLSLLGKKVPISLKIFLTTFAVVDDIGGIIVIAAFYSSHIALEYLLVSFAVIALLYLGGRYGRIHSKLFYIFFGFWVWYLFLHSGIHPTIAGVVVAFTIPARPKLYVYKYVRKIQESLSRLPEESRNKKLMLSNSELSILKSIESASDKVISPLQAIDDELHPLINYIIMPLFAFANADISFAGFSLASLQGLSLTIFFSLVLGKTIGIFSFTYLAVKSKLLSMPTHMTYPMLFGVSVLGGIGFTVSLFIASLSYANVPEVGMELLNQAKLGTIGGSVFAGVCGYFILRYVLNKKRAK